MLSAEDRKNIVIAKGYERKIGLNATKCYRIRKIEKCYT